MGCASFKENVIIEVAYCGGVGWSIPAKKVCESIKARLPKALIDCRPEEVFTGVMEINLLVENSQKRQVYRGDKDTVMKSIEAIADEVERAYANA